MSLISIDVRFTIHGCLSSTKHSSHYSSCSSSHQTVAEADNIHCVHLIQLFFTRNSLNNPSFSRKRPQKVAEFAKRIRTLSERHAASLKQSPSPLCRRDRIQQRSVATPSALRLAATPIAVPQRSAIQREFSEFLSPLPMLQSRSQLDTR